MVRAALSKTGSKWEKILSGFIGAILAAYLTPILVTLVSAFVVIPATSLSFAVGLIGMSFCEAVLAIGKDYRDHPGKLKADIRSFLLRMLEKRD